MKKLLLFIGLLLIFCNSGIAQSLELQNAFNQVNNTLKEYKFVSQDVESSGNTGRTLNIQVMLGNGKLGVLILDDFGDFADPFFGFKHGYKLIIVPLDSVEFLSGYSELEITTNNDEGVLLNYNNQKELLDKYSLCGTERNVKKIKQELEDLIEIALDENFNGDLGIPSQQSKPKKKPHSKRKK